MATETIGRIKGHDIRWNSKTGEVWVRMKSIFSNHDVKLEHRAMSIPAVFAIVEAYLYRRR